MRGVIVAALRRALAPRPGSPKEATELLESRGFDPVKVCDVKHVSAHTLYFVRCADRDYVIKVPVDSA